MVCRLARWPRHRLVRLWVLALLCLICLAYAHARPLEQMEHRRWSGADGGPSQIGALAQTADGYLWMGTNDSLFRFDGFRFTPYVAPDGKSLGIVSALLAVDKTLWVGMRGGGVEVIDDQGIRRYQAGRDLPSGVIYGLVRDHAQAVWAAADDGLARFDGQRWQKIADDWAFTGRKARAVFVDRDGIVWAASENRLFYLRPHTRTFVDAGLQVDWISRMAQAPDGSIWLAERYSGNLQRLVLRDDKLNITSTNIGTPSNGLLFDRAGGLWIGTLGAGLYYVAAPLDIAAVSQRQLFTRKDGLSADYIWPLFEDREDNLWVGTNAGLDRFRPQLLIPASFPRDALNYALAAGADGSVWAGTSNRPAMRLHGDRIERQRMPAPVTCAMRDADGTIWMAGPGGLWRSEQGRLEWVSALPANTAPDSSVRAMARDRHGDLWVSINRVGLFRWRDGNWQAQSSPSASASQIMPVVAAADPQGRVWFGYRDNLLVREDAGAAQRWQPADGLAIGHVTALLHDGERTWVGGQHGMGMIEHDRFRSLPLPENGLFDNIYAILAVPLKNAAGSDLWIHAKAGIFQLPAAELARFQADANYRIRYRSYDRIGGLANDPYQVLPLPTAVRGADDRLWFSTSKGVVWIDPHKSTAVTIGPSARIEAVTVDGVRLQEGMPAVFSPEMQRIVLDYSALSLSSPESLTFRYRLDGYDDEWHDAGQQREAVYTRLKAGDYRFRVVAHDRDGVSSPQEAVLAFTILPFFYARPIFLIPAGLVCALLLWLLYRVNGRRAAERMRVRMEARHAERERIARELHDTLLQGVQGLLLRLQVVAHAMPPHEAARRELEQSLDRAEQIVVEGRDRVRDLRVDSAEAGDLHQRIWAVGSTLENEGSARFYLAVEGATLVLPWPMQEEIYWIVREAIVNAFRHAQAQRIEVKFHYSSRQIRITIRDDGCGIAQAYAGPSGRPDHWGLRGMHERARSIAATLSIDGNADGSEIVLLIPLARDIFGWLARLRFKQNKA